MKFTPLAALFLSTLLVSCVTVNRDIPSDATSEIYFQRAQAETDASHFSAAQAIFELFLSRAPETALEQIISARYEVAVLKAKQGDSAAAIKDFESILADFQDVSRASSFPAWVKVLSQKKLLELKGPDSPKA